MKADIEPKAVCVGCGKNDLQTGEYNADDSVVDDGTYADGKFVCTECYVRLIPIGLDVGSPEIIQQRMKNLVEQEKRATP